MVVKPKCPTAGETVLKAYIMNCSDAEDSL